MLGAGTLGVRAVESIVRDVRVIVHGKTAGSEAGPRAFREMRVTVRSAREWGRTGIRTSARRTSRRATAGLPEFDFMSVPSRFILIGSTQDGSAKASISISMKVRPTVPTLR